MSQVIALVDDDRNLLTSVQMALEEEGFKVQTYIDGENALVGLTRTPPDLAVIDIKMPRMDGEELLRKLRKKTSMPVIFLTSKDHEQDEIIGLRMGASDYIKKPFSQKLLNERIRTVLRIHTNRINNNNDNNTKTNKLIKDNLILDEDRQLCFWKENEIELTVAEFNLIKSLAQYPGVVKDRNQLMDAMYGENIYVDDRTIDSHIKRLRKKFRSYDKSFDQIRTRYGSGYSWRD